MEKVSACAGPTAQLWSEPIGQGVRERTVQDPRCWACTVAVASAPPCPLTPTSKPPRAQACDRTLLSRGRQRRQQSDFSAVAREQHCRNGRGGGEVAVEWETLPGAAETRVGAPEVGERRALELQAHLFGRELGNRRFRQPGVSAPDQGVCSFRWKCSRYPPLDHRPTAAVADGQRLLPIVRPTVIRQEKPRIARLGGAGIGQNRKGGEPGRAE